MVHAILSKYSCNSVKNLKDLRLCKFKIYNCVTLKAYLLYQVTN